MPDRKLNSSHIEIAVARYLNPRINIIVPNAIDSLDQLTNLNYGTGCTI